MATVIDAVQVGNWMFASANSKGRIERPKMIPRPGTAAVVADDGKIGSGRKTMAEMRRILDTWSQRAGTEFHTHEVG